MNTMYIIGFLVPVILGLFLDIRKWRKMLIQALNPQDFDLNGKISYQFTGIYREYKKSQLYLNYYNTTLPRQPKISQEKAIKRRAGILSLYNYYLAESWTHGHTKNIYTAELGKFSNKISKGNYRKIYYGILLFLIGFTLSMQLIAQSNLQKDSYYLKAELSYSNKKYDEAIKNFKLAKAVNDKDSCTIHYKIALCFNKIQKCDSALVYYKRAWQLNSDNGGASSRQKFIDKLGECGYTLNDLTGKTEDIKDVASENYYKLKMKEADNYYRNGNYHEALSLLEEIEISGTLDYSAVFNYKMAITLGKLNDCYEANIYFERALSLDPDKGGASTREKFDKASGKCGFQQSGTGTDNSQYESDDDSPEFGMVLLSIFLGLIARFILYFVLDSLKKRNVRAVGSKFAEPVYREAANTEFWAGLSRKGFSADQIADIKNMVRNISRRPEINHTTNEGIAFAKLLNHFIQNPENYLPGDPRFNYLCLHGFYNYFKSGFYCFFTSEIIEDRKAMVVKIKYNHHEPVLVWVCPSIMKRINNKAPLKVRVHMVNEVYTHWSNDTKYHNPWSDVDNHGVISKSDWQGEFKTIDIEKYHELFTNFPARYRRPHPDSFVNMELAYTELNTNTIHKTGKKSDTNSTLRQGIQNDSDSAAGDLLMASAIGHEISHDRIADIS